MKIAQSLSSLFLGMVIAWVVLMYAPPKVSTYNWRTLRPDDVPQDGETKAAIVGAGLAVAKPSVMDPSTAPAPAVIMKNPSPATPVSAAPLATTTVKASEPQAQAPPPTVVNPATPMAPVSSLMTSPPPPPSMPPVIPPPMAPPMSTTPPPKIPSETSPSV